MTVKNKIAVVSGAAGGIGEAICRGLADGGAKVVSLDVQEARYGISIQCDVGSESGITEAAKRIKAEIGSPDILIHCAAVTTKTPLLETPISAFERVMNVNLYGALRLTQAFAPDMRVKKSGAILYISSINACFATPEQGAYAASKAALDSVVKTLSVELACDGIRVNSLRPASVASPSFLESISKSPDPERAAAANIARHPLARWGTPDDIAKLALFMVSDDASWITGAHYAIDGGAGVTRQ